MTSQTASDKEKRMARIKGVGFGVRDTSHTMLWFGCYESEHIASLQCISGKDAIKLLEKHQIRDIKDLEGKNCWVQTRNGYIDFVDLVDL